MQKKNNQSEIIETIDSINLKIDRIGKLFSTFITMNVDFISSSLNFISDEKVDLKLEGQRLVQIGNDYVSSLNN